MAETFRCPSCAAPLEFEGKTMQKCPFCSSNVIAPSDLFYGRSAAAHRDISSLTGRALAEIQQEIRRGNKINAIKIFRETFNTGLKEAKDAVEAMERGESVDLSAIQVRSIDLNVSPDDVRALQKAGVAVGGSIMAVTAVVALIIVAAVGIAIYFAVAKTPAVGISTPIGNTNSTPKPAASSSDVDEVLKVGGEGTGAGRFKDNRDVAVGPNGEIYSADYQGGRIQVFDAAGTFVTQWNVEERRNLYDLAADRKGRLYVANSGGIWLYEGATGKLVNKANTYHVRGMALGADSRLTVIADRGLMIMDADLKVLNEYKDAAEQASSSSGFRRVAVDGHGNIFAMELSGGDICKFSPQGKFLNRFPSGARSANGIVIAPSGRIFVSATNTIYVLSETGQPIKSFKTTQAFGMAFNDQEELFVAARPWVIKYKLDF